MKILKLSLKAFGPFTDQELDLSGGNEGFHLIYGDNEAGKSSALRALTYLFFGIPVRTTDNFLHENAKLRIGAEIRHSDGETFEFFRRKGNKDTLLDPAGNALPDTALRRFLAGVDENLFRSLYGINHGELVQGAKDILQAGGDVGRSLFDAGLGGNNLRKVIQALDDESGAIFKTQGKQTLDRLMDEYKELRKAVRELSQPSRVWKEHEETLNRAREEKEGVIRKLGELSNEMKRIERIERTLPKIATLQGIDEDLKDLASAMVLSGDFAETRRDTQRQLEQARSDRDKSHSALDQIQGKTEALDVPEELLKFEESINEVYEHRGSHVKATRDLPGLRSTLQQSRTQAQEILKELRPGLGLEEVESLRLTESQRVRIQDLGSQFESLSAELRASSERIEELDEGIKEQKQELLEFPTLPDSQNIEQAASQADRVSDLEELVAQRKAELWNIKKQSQIDLKRLGLWENSLDDLEELTLPLAETIDRFDSDFNSLENERANLNKDIDRIVSEIEEIDTKLAEIQHGGAVPREQDLEQARKKRDERWQFVRRAWIDGAPYPVQEKDIDPDRSLAQAYEQSVRNADDMADLMRWEADKVAQMNGLTSRRVLLNRSIEELLSQKQRDLENKASTLDEAWRREWRFLTGDPLPPKEMRAWRVKQEELAQQAQQIREIDQEVVDLVERISEHCNRMEELLREFGQPTADGASLKDLIERCKQVVSDAYENRTRRRDLEKSIANLEGEHPKAKKKQNHACRKLDEWRTGWSDAVDQIGLTKKDTPAQANAVLSKIQDLFTALKDADGDRGRIEAIEQDAEQFEKMVRTLTGQVAPELIDQSAEQAAAQLNSKLNQARENTASLKELKEQQENERDNLSEAERVIKETEEQLKELCDEAGCSEGEIEGVEERSAQKRKLLDSRGEVETRLLEIGEGFSIDELKKEIESVDADDIPAQKLKIREEIQELETKRDEWNQKIGSEETELKKMDGSSKAAEAEQQAQSVLAMIQDETERFGRLRLAHTILKQEIERYREQNQDPLLKRASELFKQLTLGSFSTLQTDYDEKDQPILIGVRDSEEQLIVEGMSDGTLDQLYLSLRLASLERNLEANEPIPFIVDDVLINFDDSRAAAALETLAELSLKTQLLCFTHHRRLVELAQAVLDDGVLYIHTLEK